MWVMCYNGDDFSTIEMVCSVFVSEDDAINYILSLRSNYDQVVMHGSKSDDETIKFEVINWNNGKKLGRCYSMHYAKMKG